jgi:tetratricopeptide (TPR) repeat protein
MASPSLYGEDVGGLLDASARLCSILTTQDQKVLGLELAQRARTLAQQDAKTAMALARCAYFRADWETDAQVRGAVAQAGIDAALAAGAKDGKPEAAYLYALTLGLTMRDRGLEALGMIPDEIAALETAREDSAQDLGGPLRVLGMIYLKAPAWPAGPGDLDTALELLQEAVSRYPSHPLNRIFYAQALKEDGKSKEATEQLNAAIALARPELWGDYAARWKAEATALQQ